LDLIPDLSREQRVVVQEIRQTFLPKVHGIRENLRRERVELAKLLFSEPTDRNGICEVAKQVLEHQSELEREVIEHILEEKELLTPSQKKKFYEIIAMHAIMLTGFPTIQTAKRAEKLGADQYCVKPIEIDELEQRVASILGASPKERS
jgi:hypothetical protein